MQCFEDVDKINVFFVKWYVVELVGVVIGYWQCVFQVDSGDMVNIQFQFGGYVVFSGVEVVDVWINGELW